MLHVLALFSSYMHILPLQHRDHNIKYQAVVTDPSKIKKQFLHLFIYEKLIYSEGTIGNIDFIIQNIIKNIIL